MSDMTVETIELGDNLRVRIEYDTDVEMPEDDIFQITYRASSRYTLGTEGISDERKDEIERGLADGSLIGWPVFAYVHSGSTIRMAETNPFHCPWDSGQSGVVYAKREDVLKEWGNKRLTKAVIAKAQAYAKGVVETFASYLEGDVYGYIVERTRVNADDDVVVEKTLDSCWGFYGLDYAKGEGKEAAEHYKQ